MNKKKIIRSLLVVATCFTIGAAVTITANSITISGGRIEFLETGQSVFIGKNAGNLDAFSNTTRAQNAGVGENAMPNVNPQSNLQEGTRNACLGGNCMHDLTFGDRNACVGIACLYGSVTGDHNVALGYHAGASIVTGDANSAIGYFSMERCSGEAGGNTAVGNYSLFSVDGYRNTCIGRSCGISLKKGDNNVFVGMAAGGKLKAGSGNVLIGYNAQASKELAHNEINIAGVFKSKDKYKGDVKMRSGAGLILVDAADNKAYKLSVVDGLLKLQETVY